MPWLETLKWTTVVLGTGWESMVALMALAMAWGPVSDSVSTVLMNTTLHAAHTPRWTGLKKQCHPEEKEKKKERKLLWMMLSNVQARNNWIHRSDMWINVKHQWSQIVSNSSPIYITKAMPLWFSLDTVIPCESLTHSLGFVVVVFCRKPGVRVWQLLRGKIDESSCSWKRSQWTISFALVNSIWASNFYMTFVSSLASGSSLTCAHFVSVFFPLMNEIVNQSKVQTSLVTKGWAVLRISSGQWPDIRADGHGDSSIPLPILLWGCVIF